MRRIRYAVAASLDGYIAGPQGETDWIVTNPEIDFGEIFSQFDTLLIGRRTFDSMRKAGRSSVSGMKLFVFSRTLQQSDCPEATVVSHELEKVVAEIRATPGKDIWLFGGGTLFSSLMDMKLVDTVEFAVMPVLLGKGIPLAPALTKQIKLNLTAHKVYKKTGIVSLEYAAG